MNHKLKRKWVNSLRGGNYSQCRWLTRLNDTTFCAMGLLNHIEPIVKFGEYIKDPVLPMEITRKLVKMNDSGKTFSEIADWIEENL